MERVCVSAFFVSSEFESNENDKKRELDEMCEDRDMVELCENVEKTDIFDSEYDQELYEICTMYENLFDSEYDTNLYEICTTIENNVINDCFQKPPESLLTVDTNTCYICETDLKAEEVLDIDKQLGVVHEPDWEETMPLTRSPIGSRSSLCEESSEMFADGRTTNVPTLSRAHAAGLRGNTTVGTSTETSGTVYRGTTRRTRAVTAAAAAAANAVNAAHVQELPPSSALNALHVAQLTDATASEKGTNSKNIGGPLEKPPFVSSIPLVPTAPPRSMKSTRRVELETRLQLEKQKLEIAQAKAAITRIQLELS
ncbi:hypothetical protein K1T71_015166 [Dendrolimus kikuchii]|nr:hypothetical protein K1T71_015166 [Dendrolimus kikuchii]